MQNSHRAILGTLDGAEEFLDQNAEALGGVAANGTRKKLGTIVSALTSHHTTQTQSVVSAQQLTLSTSAARRALLQDHLASIAAVAKAALPTVPELALARRAPKAHAPIGTLLTPFAPWWMGVSTTHDASCDTYLDTHRWSGTDLENHLRREVQRTPDVSRTLSPCLAHQCDLGSPRQATSGATLSARTI